MLSFSADIKKSSSIIVTITKGIHNGLRRETFPQGFLKCQSTQRTAGKGSTDQLYHQLSRGGTSLVGLLHFPQPACTICFLFSEASDCLYYWPNAPHKSIFIPCFFFLTFQVRSVCLVHFPSVPHFPEHGFLSKNNRS